MTWILQSLMSKYKVEGFPTILVFGADKENPFPYQGARVASAIESFALEQLEANAAPPEVSELTGPVSFRDINKVILLWRQWSGIDVLTRWFGFCRTPWKRNVLLLPFALYLSFQISWIQRPKEETSTLSCYYLLLRNLKGVHTGKIQLNLLWTLYHSTYHSLSCYVFWDKKIHS